MYYKRTLLFLLWGAFFLHGCGNMSSSDTKCTGPLKEPYEYFDSLNKSAFHFDKLDSRMALAKGQNDKAQIEAVNKDFATAQSGCLKKLDEKFPVGSVKIPFEQKGSSDSVKVNAIYVSGFEFPWTTATSICYSFTVEYQLQAKDLWYAKIPLTFLDSEGDILYQCNVPADSSGKTKFPVKAQDAFRIFSKIIIN